MKHAAWTYVQIYGQPSPFELRVGAQGTGKRIGTVYDQRWDGLPLADRVIHIEANATAQG